MAKGKAVNPADQHRKKLKQLDLKKNKAHRDAMRQRTMLAQDPKALFQELDELEYGENKHGFGPIVMEEKKRKLRDTISRVVTFLEKENPEQHKEFIAWRDERVKVRARETAAKKEEELARAEAEAALMRSRLPPRLDDIPLPDAEDEQPEAYDETGQTSPPPPPPPPPQHQPQAVSMFPPPPPPGAHFGMPMMMPPPPPGMRMFAPPPPPPMQLNNPFPPGADPNQILLLRQQQIQQQQFQQQNQHHFLPPPPPPPANLASQAAPSAPPGMPPGMPMMRPPVPLLQAPRPPLPPAPTRPLLINPAPADDAQASFVAKNPHLATHFQRPKDNAAATAASTVSAAPKMRDIKGEVTRLVPTSLLRHKTSGTAPPRSRPAAPPAPANAHVPAVSSKDAAYAKFLSEISDIL